MMREVGIQYTIFTRGEGYRQAFFNAIAPENLDTMTEQTIINWASRSVNEMHPDKMILIDSINREGRVNDIYKFES